MDYTLGDTIYYAFTTRAFATGVPTALAGSPTLEIYENDSTSPIVEGASKLVLTQNLASINGFNLATITATSGNGFEAGKTYHIILKTGTVGGTSVVGEVVGRFTLNASSALKPTIAGRTLVVDAAGLADANAVKVGPSGSGTAQTARDIGASVLLSAGTGTGQLDFTSGVVKANAVQLLGTAWLTPGTAGTPDVNAKLWNGLTTVALPLVPTVAGRTLDVSATGEAGVDWANVGTPGSTVNLSATTVNLCNTITTYTGNTAQTGDSYAIVNSGVHGNAAIKGYVDDIGVAGAGLTAIPQAGNPGEAWYVSTSGNNGNSGRNPSTAKLTIQAAVTAAASGDTIYIAPGTYNEEVDTANKSLRLIGAGRGVTILQPSAAVASQVLNLGTGSLAMRGMDVSTTLHSFAINQSAGATPSYIDLDECTVSDSAADGQGIRTEGVVAKYYFRRSAINGTAIGVLTEDGIDVIVDECVITGAVPASFTAYRSCLCLNSFFLARSTTDAQAVTALEIATGSTVYPGRGIVRNCTLGALGSTNATVVGLSAILTNASSLGQVLLDAVTISSAGGAGSTKYDIRLGTGNYGSVYFAPNCKVDTAKFDTTLQAGSGVIQQTPLDVIKLSGDATAADNAEAFFDGTGYAGTGNTIPTVTTVTNAVAITSNIKKNQALAAFEFMMTDSTNHSPATGKTVTVTRSIDGGAFAGGTLSAVTEISNGMYKVDFAAADLNGKVVVLRATATGCDDTFERIVTQA